MDFALNRLHPYCSKKQKKIWQHNTNKLPRKCLNICSFLSVNQSLLKTTMHKLTMYINSIIQFKFNPIAVTATLFTFLWQNTEDNRREKKIVTTFLLATRKITMSFLSELKVYNQAYNFKGIVTIIIPLTFLHKTCYFVQYFKICLNLFYGAFHAACSSAAESERRRMEA